MFLENRSYKLKASKQIIKMNVAFLVDILKI